MSKLTKGLLSLSIITFSAVKSNDDQQLMPSNNIHQAIFYDAETKNFSVEGERELIPIKRCFVDKELRGIDSDKLQRLLTAGAYLSVKKLDDSNDHALYLKGKLEGGGPMFGAFLYWLTKGVGYGVPVAVGASAAGAVVGSVGGTAAGNAASIGGAYVQGSITSTAMTTFPATTMMTTVSSVPVVGFASAGGSATLTAAQIAVANASIMAPVLPASMAVSNAAGAAAMLPYAVPSYALGGGIGVGKAIVTTVGVQAAGMVTAGVVTAANGAAAYVGAVEGTATTLGILGTAIPFLP